MTFELLMEMSVRQIIELIFIGDCGQLPFLMARYLKGLGSSVSSPQANHTHFMKACPRPCHSW